jgi:hypothetical protein
MYFTDCAPQAGFRVKILDHGNPRCGKALDVDPPIGSIRPVAARHGRVGGTDSGGGRVAQQAREAAGDTLQAGSGVALIAKPDPERLDGVGDIACVDFSNGIEDLRWKSVVVVPSQVVPMARIEFGAHRGEYSIASIFTEIGL